MSRPIRVLLVEDNPGDARLVEHALAEALTAFSLDRVHRLEDVRSRLEKGPVDVVLLDLSLPDASGIGTVVRARAAMVDTPIVVLTGLEDEDVALAAVQAGAQDYLPKDNLDARLLGRTLRYAIERHRLQTELDRARRERVTELERHVNIDPLTGVASRRHFASQLDGVFSSAKRHGHGLALAVCDIDDFKSVNDRYGHQCGDEVLRAFGGILDAELREEDVSGRYGGDEFCVAFPHVTAVDATVALERIRTRLAGVDFDRDDGSTFRVTVTCGVAALGGHASAEALFQAADAVLYHAKESGRNCVRIASGPREPGGSGGPADVGGTG